jgi:predicted aconitase
MSFPAATARVDIDYLKSIVEYGVQPIRDTCTYVGHMTERRTKCGKYSLYNLVTIC